MSQVSAFFWTLMYGSKQALLLWNNRPKWSQTNCGHYGATRTALCGGNLEHLAQWRHCSAIVSHPPSSVSCFVPCHCAISSCHIIASYHCAFSLCHIIVPCHCAHDADLPQMAGLQEVQWRFHCATSLRTDHAKLHCVARCFKAAQSML